MNFGGLSTALLPNGEPDPSAFRKQDIQMSSACTFFQHGDRTFFGQVSRFAGWFHIKSLPQFALKMMTSSWCFKIHRVIDAIRDHGIAPNDLLFAQYHSMDGVIDENGGVFDDEGQIRSDFVM